MEQPTSPATWYAVFAVIGAAFGAAVNHVLVWWLRWRAGQADLDREKGRGKKLSDAGAMLDRVRTALHYPKQLAEVDSLNLHQTTESLVALAIAAGMPLEFIEGARALHKGIGLIVTPLQGLPRGPLLPGAEPLLRLQGYATPEEYIRAQRVSRLYAMLKEEPLLSLHPRAKALCSSLYVVHQIEEGRVYRQRLGREERQNRREALAEIQRLTGELRKCLESLPGATRE